MRIREATSDDSRAIARIQVDSWRDAFRGLLPDEYLDEELNEVERARYWQETLSGLGDRETVLVADEGDSIAGFVHAGPTGEPAEGELYAMHVTPALRRRGIGFDLHDAALRRLRRGGFSGARLWLLKDNALARRFYERQGWLTDGAERDAKPSGSAVEVRYARPL